MKRKGSIVIVAPNSFERILHQSWENQFQLLTSSLDLASLVNLTRLFKARENRPLDRGWKGTNPMAGYYLESFLKVHGYDARCVFDWHDDGPLRDALRIDPIAIALSTTYVTDNGMLSECLQELRRVIGNLPIIVGGPYIWKQKLQWSRERALQPAERQAYAEFGVDLESDCLFSHQTEEELRRPIYIASEFGERTLIKVLEVLATHGQDLERLAEIPNVVLPCGNDQWIMTPEEIEAISLDRDFTRWDLIDDMPALVPIRTSVGCPYRCRYCDFIELHPKVIKRTPASLLEEVGAAQKRGARFFNLIDDNIFLTKERIADLTKTLIENEIEMIWGGFFRVDRVEPDNIADIYRSGCRYGMCGIESADDEQLKRMRKGCKQEEIARGIELCCKAGIQLLLTFIVGYPGESRTSIDHTIAFANNITTSSRGYCSYQVYPFYLLPTTSVDSLEYRREFHLYGRHGTWRHATMTFEEAADIYAKHIFRMIENLPYEYYATDCPIGWSVDKRNTAFNSRRRLTIGFIDASTENERQEEFANLFHVVTGRSPSESPGWREVLAPAEYQPGQRKARVRLGA